MRFSVSYIPPHNPYHLETDLKYMKSIGCTDVLFALQENHFQWLNGSVRFGPEIAKKHGLEPSAVIWGYANTSGGGRSSKVMLENPDMWRCDENGQAYGGGWPEPRACYNNPKTVEKYAEYIEKCSENGITGIMIDEPHRQDCFCKYCRKKFRDMTGNDLVEKKGTDEYRQFQDKTTIDFVIASCDAVKNVNESLQTQLCMMPVHKDLFDCLCKIDNLDVFATDPYWLRPVNKLPFEEAVKVTKYAKELSDKYGKLFELYLGCFGIDSGKEEKIYSGSKVLIDESQPFKVTTWSYLGGLGLDHELMEEESDNPELAWQSIEKLYKELSGSE